MHNILAKKKMKSAMIVVLICRHDHFIYLRIVYQHVSADNFFAIKNSLWRLNSKIDNAEIDKGWRMGSEHG